MRNRVRELRAAHSMSQGALGDAIGVSRQTINAIENGRHDPSLSLAFGLASVFNLPIESIFTPDEQPDE